jgi:type I restriction enzyme M protein
MYHERQPVHAELAVITLDQVRGADYNLSPGRWAVQAVAMSDRPIADIVAEILDCDDRAREVDAALAKMLAAL